MRPEADVAAPLAPDGHPHPDRPAAPPPQGHASWPHTPSTLERLAAWVATRPGLSARTRRLRNRLASSASRMMGLLLGLLALAGLAGIGLAASHRVAFHWDDVLATCVVVALWAGNRALRARWQSTGLYEPRAGRSWFPRPPAWRTGSAPPRPPSRVARVRRK